MALQILIAVLVVFTLEVVSTGIMFRRLYHKVHILNVWIAAIDEIQDWQLDIHLRERQAYEEFKQALTDTIGPMRAAPGGMVGSDNNNGTTLPLENPTSTDKHKSGDEASKQPNERPYWTTSFDGDPNASDPSKRGERSTNRPAEQRSGDVGE